MSRRVSVLAAAVATVLTTALAGSCSTGPTSTGDRGGADTASRFPLTIDNCGHQVTLEKPPQRVVLILRNDVPLLTAVGALDSVVGKAGEFPAELYDPATLAALQDIPTIGGAQTHGGTVSVSLEAVLAMNPDAVLGVLADSGITRGALARAGIPYIASPSQGDCAIHDPGFRSVYQQVRLYGQVFGHEQQAEAAVARLRDRVAGTQQRIPAQPDQRGSAAAVFVPQGGRQVTVYGNSSMIDAGIEAVGLTNVFGDGDFRRTEVAFEEVLARNPDYLIVLTLGDLHAAKDAVRALPGARSLDSVRHGRVLALKFDYTDPPTPFSVRGLEMLAREIGRSQ